MENYGGYLAGWLYRYLRGPRAAKNGWGEGSRGRVWRVWARMRGRVMRVMRVRA